MIRYYLAAASLKLFSATPATRRFYRQVLGNRIGSRRRTKLGLTSAYTDQASLLLRLCRKHAALRDGMTILEVGTGWIHFYSLFLRLFYEVRITLVDAWDNRQLPALKRTFAQLEPELDARFELTGEDRARATEVFGAIRAARSFDELYAVLGLAYTIDATLDSLPGSSYDLIYSFHVLEHIAADSVPRHLANMQRLLRPGGFEIHQLGLDDHLAHYDAKVHSKNHLRYSRRTWRLFFENEVQYFSRILPSEWRRLFAASGMEMQEEVLQQCDPHAVVVHPEFGAVSDADRSGVIPTFVLRKPAASGLAAAAVPQ